MSQNVLNQELFRQAFELDRVFEKVHRLWASLKDAPGANGVKELGQLISDMVVLAQAPRKLYRETWDKIRAGEIEDLRGAGQAVFHLWDLVIHELSYLQHWGVILAKCGVTIPELTDLERALKQTQTERDEAHRFWPWWTPEDNQAAWEEHRQGRSIPVEEILSELQGSRQ
jgi:hypothetical protein